MQPQAFSVTRDVKGEEAKQTVQESLTTQQLNI